MNSHFSDENRIVEKYVHLNVFFVIKGMLTPTEN